MKKSYHSSDVPTRLATTTRRRDEAGTVPEVDVIGGSLVCCSGAARTSTHTRTRLRATAPSRPRGGPGPRPPTVTTAAATARLVVTRRPWSPSRARPVRYAGHHRLDPG